MAEEDLDDVVTCADCKALFDPDLQRGYVIEEDVEICAACAARRGGLYDERRDEWVKAPDVADLVTEPDVDD
jgi:hypothetical protein